MRKFTKVAPSLWRSQKFRALPHDRDRLYYHYLLTNQHQNSAGVYHIPDAYAAEDLGWPQEAVAEARENCIQAGLIMHDAATSEILIRQWFTHNPATNDRHAKGVLKLIEAVDSEKLRETARVEFESAEFRRPADKRKAKAAASLITDTTRALTSSPLTRANPRKH